MRIVNNENSKEIEVDLDWLAFQYIANELTEDQVVEFESELASELPSGDLYREAVVRAMEQARLIHASLDGDAIPSDQKVGRTVAASQKPIARKGEWKSRIVFAASVVLALLAGGWAMTVYNGESSADSNDALADVWANAFNGFDSFEETVDDPLAEFVSYDDSDILEMDYESEDTSWIFAALTDLDETEVDETIGEM